MDAGIAAAETVLGRARMPEKQFSTRLTRLFNIRHPVLAGGLMWLSDAP